MPTDPVLYALYQENLRLRELLKLVSEDLERRADQDPAWRACCDVRREYDGTFT